MAFEMTLWRVSGGKLESLPSAVLDQEQRLEEWICRDPSFLGLDVMLVGRQVQTAYGGRIDLLALDGNGNCVVLELKRDCTPREIVAQLLDYGTWVKDLGYQDLDQIAKEWAMRDLATLFQDTFGEAIPDTINATHSLVVVASELDDSSERIISYLSEDHNVDINAVFFRFFKDNGIELLGRAWLKDPAETSERAEGRKRAPWTGYWFVNVGEGDHRNWDDNRNYNYIGAGQAEKYSRPLQKLRIGDKMFAYMKGVGYVGYGEVTKEAVPIKDFVVDAQGKRLLDLPLRAPHAAENKDSAEKSEWAVGVHWITHYPREQAKTFSGAFANQNIVCKLRDSETLEFLRSQFRIGD